MARMFWIAGCVLAGLAVGAGAFAAHALRSRLDPAMLEIVETAARYQMYHALGLLAVAWAADRFGGTAPLTAGWLFLTGILLFSGSLYLLALTGERWVGAITPLGGVSFLLGWVALAWVAVRSWG